MDKFVEHKRVFYEIEIINAFALNKYLLKLKIKHKWFKCVHKKYIGINTNALINAGMASVRTLK